MRKTISFLKYHYIHNKIIFWSTEEYSYANKNIPGNFWKHFSEYRFYDSRRRRNILFMKKVIMSLNSWKRWNKLVIVLGKKINFIIYIHIPIHYLRYTSNLPERIYISLYLMYNIVKVLLKWFMETGPDGNKSHVSNLFLLSSINCVILILLNNNTFNRL